MRISFSKVGWRKQAVNKFRSVNTKIMIDAILQEFKASKIIRGAT